MDEEDSNDRKAITNVRYVRYEEERDRTVLIEINIIVDEEDSKDRKAIT